jgi:hypothetical protein
MKYFLHDTSAFDDEKITELYLQFGYEGLGLFYTCLEKIGKQEKPVKTEVLKAQLRVGKRLEKCWSFMEEIGLISSNNGETFNKQLLNFSEKYQIKKEKTREKVSEWRKKQQDIENVTGYVPVSNPPKVKESKVKVNKEEELKARSLKFKESVFAFKEKYEEIMLLAFYDYWSEANKSKTKMRFELEPVFEIPKRLATWHNKELQFKNYGTTRQTNQGSGQRVNGMWDRKD